MKLNEENRTLLFLLLIVLTYLSVGTISYIPISEDITVEIPEIKSMELSQNIELEATTEELEVEVLQEVAIAENELYMLAHIIYAEAGNCSDQCQMYVGSVVLNRIASEYYPNDMYSVIHQSGQYGPITNGSYYKEPNERTWSIAQELLENGSVLPADVIGQTGGPGGSGTYAVIDGIYFNYR